ncbi:hypothetical protein HMPREF0388_0071 [Mobiluncus curtisii ATCC 51333]|uniref:Uncharacterized protein n=1 Tax=Mobiluncus curtisii ATCC 51333 TaxID=887326 RepID=E6LW34_9ACTO|nr:hypothetical protein HMPREF0388_0071 [Mobiluncus curtisii ATCC 51333]
MTLATTVTIGRFSTSLGSFQIFSSRVGFELAFSVQKGYLSGQKIVLG